MTLIALAGALVILAVAVYLIFVLAILVLEQRRLIDQLETNYAEQAKLMTSQRATILDLGSLCEEYANRDTRLEQLISRWIMSRPAMVAPRVMRMGASSVEMN